MSLTHVHNAYLDTVLCDMWFGINVIKTNDDDTETFVGVQGDSFEECLLAAVLILEDISE